MSKLIATFEGWRLGSLAPPRGPFQIEVSKLDSRKYVAEVLPTRQRIGGVSRPDQQATCAAVSALFERQVEPWSVIE